MNDCTDLVAEGENTIFKVLYMCSLKLRRYADLIFLNLRTPYCVLCNLVGTVASLRDASNMAVCDESEVCVTHREHFRLYSNLSMMVARHV